MLYEVITEDLHKQNLEERLQLKFLPDGSHGWAFLASSVVGNACRDLPFKTRLSKDEKTFTSRHHEERLQLKFLPDGSHGWAFLASSVVGNACRDLPFKTRLSEDEKTFTSRHLEERLHVITSYSIHYTKLYEKAL